MIPPPYCEPCQIEDLQECESWGEEKKFQFSEEIQDSLEFIDHCVQQGIILFGTSSREDLQQRFREQADKWARETQHLSSPAQMMTHPSYQAILGMAQEDKREVIRLLLLDLQKNRNEWFWALSFLTQANPIKAADSGKMDKMISAWVEWGRSNSFI